MIQLGSAYGEIILGTGEAEKSVKSLAQQMRDVGAGMSLAISTPIIGVAAAGLHAAAGFEESMNLIQTVGGATAEQMQAVQSQALQLGKDTSFSAGEAADGFLELTKAGFDVESSMGAIGGVLDLAAAGNLSVASAAEIAANAINAFQLPASDAGRIADMLAAGANASSVEVTDLNDSLKMSGAVMGSYGQSLDDTVTALGLLGNAGLKGSDAGTALKQMFISLAAPTDEARKLMSSLGISIYDAQGNMLAMPDILANLQQAMFGVSETTVEVGGRTAEQSAELKRLQGVYKRTQASISDYETGAKGASLSDEARQKKLAALRSEMAQQQTQIQALAGITGTATTVQRQLTEEERNAAMATLFGTDAVRSANILLQAGTDGWNDMSRAVNKGGAAAEVAESRQKGFNGAMEYFKGTMESLLIEVLLPFLDTLSGGLRWIADLITLFTQLPQPVQYAALAFLAVLAATGPVLLALSGLVTVLGFLLSPIGLIAVAVAALAAAWVSNWGDIQGKVKAVWDYVKPIFDSIVGWLQTTAGQALTFLQGKWNEVWPTLQGAVSTAWAAVEPTFIAIRDWVQTKLQEGITTLQAAWQTAWPAIQAAVSTAWTTMQSVFMAVVGWLAAAIPIAVGFLGGVWSTVWTALQTAVSNVWGVIGPIFASIGGWVKTNLPNALPTLQTAWSNAWAAIRTAASGAWLTIEPYLQSALSWVKTNLPNALPTLQTAWSNAWAAIRTAASSAWTVIEPYFTEMVDWVKSKLPDNLPTLQSLWETTWSGIQTATTAAWIAIAPYLESVRSWVETKLPVVLPILQAAWDDTWTAIKTAVVDAWTEIAPKLAQIEAWMAEQYPAAVEKADQATGESLPAATEKSNAFIEALKLGWGGLIEWFEPIVQRFVTSFHHMIAGFSEMGSSFQGVWEAIQPVIRYIEVAFAGLLLVLGAIVAGVVAIFLNLASAIMDGVVPIVQGVVDLIAGVFESISVGWKGTVDLVGSLIAGNWTAAWAAAGEIVRATGMLFTAIWAGVWGVIYGILTIIGSFVKSVLEDMGVDVDANLQVISQLWDTAWNGALGLIKAVVAGWIALWTTVRQWLVWTLPGAANALKTKFETTWNAIKNFLLGAIAPIISAFETIRTFLTETLPNAASSFKEFLGNLHLPNPFNAIASAISAIQSAIDAVIGRVQAFKDALSGISLPPWLGGASASGVSASSAVEPSSRSRFGGSTLAGAGGITVNVTTGPINSQIDVTELAYEVARQIRLRL